MEVLILAGLIVLNGLFAMSEIAIVTAKKSRLAALAAKGKRSARAAIRLAEDPTQFLSTVQIGITSIGIMNGIFGESILAEPFAIWLQSVGLPEQASATTATVLVVVVVTYISIVVGELVPKRLGQVSAERVACTMARPMSWLATLTKPFVMLLSASTHGLLRILPFKHSDDQAVTEEDIEALLREGSASGIIEQDEHQMVRNVLRLDDRPITSLMVPRSDIIFLDIALPLKDNYRRLMDSPHTAFPVCDQQVDNLLGVANAKDILAKAIGDEPVELSRLMRPANFVFENLTALELLDYFKSSNNQMVFVVDEYGGIQGIVTVHDLLEALAGEFGTEDDDPWVVTRDDGSLLLDGLLPVLDLKDCLGTEDLPDEGSYQTLNGLILKMMERVPRTGEKIQVQDWIMEVVDMDGHRVDKVLVTRVASGRDEDDDG